MNSRGAAKTMAKGDQGVAVQARGASVTRVDDLTVAAEVAFAGAHGGGLPGGRARSGVPRRGRGRSPLSSPVARTRTAVAKSGMVLSVGVLTNMDSALSAPRLAALRPSEWCRRSGAALAATGLQWR